MGVIPDRKVVCETGSKPPSNPESTTHSGYTTEDEGSEEQVVTYRRQPLRTLTGLNLYFNQNIGRHTGRRKTRRILNSRFLETLNEENCEDNLLEETKSKFQLLMEEENLAFTYLNELENINDSEVDDNDGCVDRKQEPYLNIPQKIRVSIGNRRNFQYDLLKSVETKMKSVTGHAMEYLPQTCYERLIVHAVAKYNGFHSETIIEDSKKIVKVITGPQLIAPQQLLCDYLLDKKQKLLKFTEL